MFDCSIMKKIIRWSGAVILTLLFLFFYYWLYDFVDDDLLEFSALLLFLLFFPYYYLFLNRAGKWQLLPSLNLKPLDIFFNVILALNIAPTVFYYWIMVDEAISWKVNNYNGGHLDSEMSSIVAIFTFFWLFLLGCFYLFFFIIYLFAARKKS